MKVITVFLLGCVIGWLLAPRRQAEPTLTVTPHHDWWYVDGATYANTLPWWVYYS